MTKTQTQKIIHLLKNSSFSNNHNKSGTIINLYSLNNIIIKYDNNLTTHITIKDFKNHYYHLNNKNKQKELDSIINKKSKNTIQYTKLLTKSEFKNQNNQVGYILKFNSFNNIIAQYKTGQIIHITLHDFESGTFTLLNKSKQLQLLNLIINKPQKTKQFRNLVALNQTNNLTTVYQA